MKKTFTANISGTVFHIEEDAYDQLQRYLANIRAKFSGSSGRDEIMADIEARIAELFSERLQGRQVVTMADVEHVQGILGQPEDFEGTTEEGATPPPPPFTAPGHKRLFRDPDDHWAGGVIGGIAAYFNMDPLWLRIAFVVCMVLGWGSPFLIYCVLWVLVPKAGTPAERLQMRGEPVTVDNIKRVFDEGTERVRTGARRVANEAEEFGRKWQSGAYQQYSQRIGSAAERFFRTLFQVLAKLVGVGVLLFGALLAFGYVSVAAGSAGFGWFDMHIDGGSSLRTLASNWFVSGEMARWAWIGAGVFCLVPILGLILAGIRLLFEIHVPRWLGWTLVPLWFASIVLLGVIAARQANDFRQRERVTDLMDVPMPADRVLHIAGAHDPWFGDDRARHSDDLDLLEIAGNEIHWGWADLDVEDSPDSLFHLKVVRSAQGVSLKEATRRAHGIQCTYSTSNDTLTLSPAYSTDRSDRLRCQQVSYIVEVPLGAAIRFERSSARLINDIKNTSNTWDGDMVGRTWTMTSQGLQAGTPGEVHPTGTPNEAPSAREHGKVAEHPGEGPVPASVPLPSEPPGLIGLLRAAVEV